jgi:hypothetical protein
MKRQTLIAFVVLVFGIALIGIWFALDSQLQVSREGFGIYLLENDTLIISDVDMLSYNKTNHGIDLTDECAKRLEEVKTPIFGRFVIRINAEEIYYGTFVPSFVSRSYPSSEPVIMTPPLSGSYDFVKIQMGYPFNQPPDVDPRNNSKIFDYFQKAGKLIQ